MEINIRVLSLILLLSAISSPLFAQYYYKDIISSRNSYEQYLVYRKNKVSKILLKPSEADGSVSEGFSMQQSFNNSYTQLKTNSLLKSGSKTSMVNYYNSQGNLYRTVDSTDEAVSIYEYAYDSAGLILSLLNTSKAIGDKNNSTEIHIWHYNEKGKPKSMQRIRDAKDSSEIRFTVDENGNTIEEQSFRKGVPGEKIYYYYDESNRLTDIVSYNDKLGKLMPDYTFDYLPDNRLSEMMIVQNGGIDYIKWRYTYLDNGLKSKEICYNKQNRLVGKIEYEYESRR
jgi:YD repeat-containing protein